MIRKFIPKPIGKPTDARIIVGRENIPIGDEFDWWSCQLKYKNKHTKEEYTLGELQNIYQLGFGQKELWDIIKCDYITEDVYVMNTKHPKYNNKSDNIVLEN